MAISADLSDPLDDTKGGDALWGHWQQDKRELVVLTLDVPAGAKARNVLVVFKSSSLKVVAVGETRMDGELCAQVRGGLRRLRFSASAACTCARCSTTYDGVYVGIA